MESTQATKLDLLYDERQRLEKRFEGAGYEIQRLQNELALVEEFYDGLFDQICATEELIAQEELRINNKI